MDKNEFMDCVLFLKTFKNPFLNKTKCQYTYMDVELAEK
jgi:hypothetical protein